MFLAVLDYEKIPGAGDGGGMEEHGNEYHDPDFVSQLLGALSAQTLVAADDIEVTDGTPYTPIQSASAITLTSEPTIAAGRNGQIAYIANVGGYNIIVQDVNALGGSLLRLLANTQTIQPGGTLVMRYDSAVGFWMQVSLLNPQSFTPSIKSFTIDGASGPMREVAAASTADAIPDFDMTYVGTPSACSIDILTAGEINAADYPIDVPSPFLTLNSGTTPPSKAFYRGDSVGATRGFRATATVSGQEGKTRDLTVWYYNRKYMGPLNKASGITSADVLSLDADSDGASTISNTVPYTVTVTTTAGEYAWFAFRRALSATGTIYFTIASERADFTEDNNNLSHTNDYGFVEGFRCFVSEIVHPCSGGKSVAASTSAWGTGTNRRYWGPHLSDDALTSDEVLSLDDTADGGSELSSTYTGQFTIVMEGEEYGWFCYPSRITGTPVFKDNATGFAVEMSAESPYTVSVTNQYGYTEDYKCYRTKNKLATTLVMDVT